MELVRRLFLVCWFASLITTNISGTIDQNNPQENVISESTTQEVSTSKKVKLDHFSAWLNVGIGLLHYHLESYGSISTNNMADKLATIKNIQKMLVAIDITLNVPEAFFDEMDADFYFGIEALKGLVDCMQGCCEFGRYQAGDRQFMFLLFGLMSFYLGTEKLKKAIKYFNTGEADNLIAA